MFNTVLSALGTGDRSVPAVEDQTALVTGASRGIGYEFANLFAADGYDVVLVSRSEDDLQSVASDLEAAHGVETTVVPADLAQPDGARDVYDRVQAADIEVDALVNNAGFGVYGRFTETDLEMELDMVYLHVYTVTVLTKLFAQDMVERGHGYILNNASVAGFVPIPTSVVYAAAKHYQRSFSEALTQELAADGVTVTTLCPGETDTGFMEQGNFEDAGYDESDLMDPSTVARAGYEGLMDGKRLVIPGLENRLKVFARRLVPRSTYIKVAERVQTAH